MRCLVLGAAIAVILCDRAKFHRRARGGHTPGSPLTGLDSAVVQGGQSAPGRGERRIGRVGRRRAGGTFPGAAGNPLAALWGRRPAGSGLLAASAADGTVAITAAGDFAYSFAHVSAAVALRVADSSTRKADGTT